MNQPTDATDHRRTIAGVLYAVSAFIIWGFSPIYWKVLAGVPAIEIIAHRVVWSFLFLLPLILLQKRLTEFIQAITAGRTLMILLSSAILVTANWLIYIWAVNNDHLLQASLGYYINPLVNVILGMIFLKERLRIPQIIAVLLAATGVIYLTVDYGQFPWISLLLAMSFGLYGLIRKMAPVSSLVGLAVETLLLTVPSLIYLVYLESAGMGVFRHGSGKIDIFLICSALVTAVPLLLFALGARRILLSSLGLIQYIGPSGMFLLAILVYNEPFSMPQLLTFIFIWTALIIYSVDSVVYFRKNLK